MSLPPLTFADLKSKMAERSRSSQGIAESSLPNAMSALKQFMQCHSCSDEQSVGSVLRASYFRNVRDHDEALAKEGRSPEYRANRKTLLKQWRRLVLDLDKAWAGAKRTESPFQHALRELLQGGLTIAMLAKGAGVPHGTLKRWLGGSVPQRGKLTYVRRLEVHCGIPAGTLSDLLPRAVSAPDQLAQPERSFKNIEHRTQLARNVKDRYLLKAAGDALRQEWGAFVQYKTSLTASGLQRQRRGKWSTTKRPGKRKPEWYESLRVLGQPVHYCATAGINWTLLAQYLGWLALPDDAGGAGLALAQVQSLACLLDTAHVERYVLWRVARSGGAHHGGVSNFLNLIAGVCHPMTGYLTQCRKHFAWHPDAGDDEAWQRRCRLAFEQARMFSQQVKDVAQCARNSKDPIAYMLSLPNPLSVVTEAIARMDAARPSTGGVTEAIWMRDRLMLKLLSSNPLRAKNLKLLTFAKDEGGTDASGAPAQLRKVNGEWRIAIDKMEFKNFAGAAKDRVYDMPVRKEVWADLEVYIREYRPVLADLTNPYLLVSSASPAEPYYGINRRFQEISRQYFPHCPGVGPHAMRHLVATTILKKHPGAWAAAAAALHDREATVRDNYAHLSSDDAARWLDDVMTEALSGM